MSSTPIASRPRVSGPVTPAEATSYETMTSDAFERLGHLLGISTDLDDPEPALIAAVERAVAELVHGGQARREPDDIANHIKEQS